MLFTFRCHEKKSLYHVSVQHVILDRSHAPAEQMDEMSISSASLLPLSLLHLLSGEPLSCRFAAKCAEMIRVLERHLHNACAGRVIRESAAVARACSTSRRRALYIEVGLLMTHAALRNMLFMVHTACPGYYGYYINVTEHVIGVPRQILCSCYQQSGGVAHLRPVLLLLPQSKEQLS